MPTQIHTAPPFAVGDRVQVRPNLTIAAPVRARPTGTDAMGPALREIPHNVAGQFGTVRHVYSGPWRAQPFVVEMDRPDGKRRDFAAGDLLPVRAEASADA
jgi:hypothetical protein